MDKRPFLGVNDPLPTAIILD